MKRTRLCKNTLEEVNSLLCRKDFSAKDDTLIGRNQGNIGAGLISFYSMFSCTFCISGLDISRWIRPICLPSHNAVFCFPGNVLYVLSSIPVAIIKAIK